MNSSFSGKCQIANIAKFNSTLIIIIIIIRDLQYPEMSGLCCVTFSIGKIELDKL